MALEWIKMRCDLPEDPTVISIAADLHLTEDAVVGKLLRLWAWADRHLVDGYAPGVTASWVDDLVRAPGFAAGPCLLKDTMQLAAFARNQFGLGQAAMQVNEGLVLQLVDDLRRSYDISKMTVGLLGMAFKAEIDDTRASLSYKLKRTLQMFAREVLTTDPFVTTDPTLLPFDEVVDRSDMLILCTPHKAFRSLNIKDKPVLDIWNFYGKGCLLE